MRMKFSGRLDKFYWHLKTIPEKLHLDYCVLLAYKYLQISSKSWYIQLICLRSRRHNHKFKDFFISLPRKNMSVIDFLLVHRMLSSFLLFFFPDWRSSVNVSHPTVVICHHLPPFYFTSSFIIQYNNSAATNHTCPLKLNHLNYLMYQFPLAIHFEQCTASCI